MVGKVRLVQKVDNGKIYAMKTLQKDEMVKRDQLAHVRAERDVLAESNSPWVVQLFYSFQDSAYLYLVMEVGHISSFQHRVDILLAPSFYQGAI
jgi:protein-serine/threonine kinase